MAARRKPAAAKPAPKAAPAPAPRSSDPLAARLYDLAERCPAYPSLDHPDLPRGFSLRLPGLAEPIPVEVVQRAVLVHPPLMATLVLGLQLEPFHEAWLDWSFRHPQSALEASRGFGKSTIGTTVFAIVQICRDFDVRILITSERDDQVVGFLAEIRAHLEHCELLKTLFGTFLGAGKWTDHKLVIAQRRKRAQKEGTLDAVQMGGAVTGRHWEIVIVDDPTSQTTAWSPTERDKAFAYYFSTLKPVLMPGGWLLIRATRYHYEDLLGRLEREIALDRKTGESHVYHYEDLVAGTVQVPRNARMKVLKTSAIMRDGRSLWEARNPLRDRVNADGSVTEGLLSIRQDMGERAFGEQYQMECRPPEADRVRETECREAWLPEWDAPPALTELEVVLRVDPAWTDAEKAARKHAKDRKPAWSAIAVAGARRAAKRGEASFFLLEIEAGLWSPLELTAAMRARADAWAARLHRRTMTVGLERTGLQIRAAPDFYRSIRAAMAPHRVVFVNPQMNKLAYARPFFVAAERGEVRLAPEVLASGFARACGDVPDPERWDEIDAAAGAYRMVQRARSNLTNFEARNDARGGGDRERGPNARALAYAARATSMVGGIR